MNNSRFKTTLTVDGKIVVTAQDTMNSIDIIQSGDKISVNYKDGSLTGNANINAKQEFSNKELEELAKDIFTKTESKLTENGEFAIDDLEKILGEQLEQSVIGMSARQNGIQVADLSAVQDIIQNQLQPSQPQPSVNKNITAEQQVLNTSQENNTKMLGIVKVFKEDKGYGFIRGVDGNDYYVNRKNIANKTLEKGQTVEFDVVEHNGKKFVKNVEISNQTIEWPKKKQEKVQEQQSAPVIPEKPKTLEEIELIDIINTFKKASFEEVETILREIQEKSNPRTIEYPLTDDGITNLKELVPNVDAHIEKEDIDKDKMLFAFDSKTNQIYYVNVENETGKANLIEYPVDEFVELIKENEKFRDLYCKLNGITREEFDHQQAVQEETVQEETEETVQKETVQEETEETVQEETVQEETVQEEWAETNDSQNQELTEEEIIDLQPDPSNIENFNFEETMKTTVEAIQFYDKIIEFKINTSDKAMAEYTRDELINAINEENIEKIENLIIENENEDRVGIIINNDIKELVRDLKEDLDLEDFEQEEEIEPEEEYGPEW